MMGQFWSRAASREAMAVEEEVTFCRKNVRTRSIAPRKVRQQLTMAGIANSCSWAYSKRRRTSSPTMTPDLRESFSRAPIVTIVENKKGLWWEEIEQMDER
jgi:hypothetical protein